VRGRARALSLVVRESGELSAQEVARALGLPLAARVREETALRRAVDRGDGLAALPRGPFSRTCRDLLGELLGASRVGDRAA
jgi:hypothetical protein